MNVRSDTLPLGFALHTSDFRLQASARCCPCSSARREQEGQQDDDGEDDEHGGPDPRIPIGWLPTILIVRRVLIRHQRGFILQPIFSLQPSDFEPSSPRQDELMILGFAPCVCNRLAWIAVEYRPVADFRAQ